MLRGHADAKTAAAVAKLLMSTDPNAYSQVLQTVAKNARLFNFFKTFTPKMVAAIIPPVLGNNKGVH